MRNEYESLQLSNGLYTKVVVITIGTNKINDNVLNIGII